MEGGLRPRRLLPGETRVNLSRDKALDLIRRYESGEGLSVEQRNLLMLYPPLEALESRKGPSNVNLYYLSNSAAIRLANEVFGPDGWSSSIIASNPPMIEFDKGKYKVTAIVHNQVHSHLLSSPFPLFSFSPLSFTHFLFLTDPFLSPSTHCFFFRSLSFES